MRKQTKKILSLVMSAAMALSLGVGVDMTKASAADTVTDITSIEYNMTISNVAEAGEVKVTATDGAWANPEKSFSVSADGDYTVKIDGLSKTMKNLGFFSSKTAMTINVTSIVINEKYKMTMDKVGEIDPTAINPTSQTANGLANIWNDAGKAKVVAKGDDAYLSFDEDSESIIMYVGAATSTPSDAPSVAPSEEPSAAPSEEPKAPTADQLVGTAQLDSQANGWCGNEDCVNVKAEINGPGTYVVSSNWDEVQEDPQAYCAMTCADLKDIASYITFSDVTVWVDGKVVDMPVIYGGDKDCRIQLWNTWANEGVGAGCEVPENLPETFYEIKVQFTIGLRETPRDWDAEALDTSLINIDTTKENYEPERKPEEPTIVDPTPTPVVTKNPAKSVKAAKKSVTVKKGKKANLTFKVTAADNKKVTTDKVSATSSNKKAVKVTKVTTKAGKVVVSVKGVKKGSAKVTVKVGSKKATTKVKVK